VTKREHPDVAIVGVDGQHSHALDLISATVKQAACPVIADIESDDDSFLKNASPPSLRCNRLRPSPPRRG
jgi:hypothetical protein